MTRLSLSEALVLCAIALALWQFADVAGQFFARLYHLPL